MMEETNQVKKEPGMGTEDTHTQGGTNDGRNAEDTKQRGNSEPDQAGDGPDGRGYLSDSQRHLLDRLDAERQSAADDRAAGAGDQADGPRAGLPVGQAVVQRTRGEWQLTRQEQDLLGVKPGDPLGPGIVGQPIPQSRVVAIGDLLAKLRDLADKWEDEATKNPHLHGDPWIRAKDDCAEELRAVLRGA